MTAPYTPENDEDGYPALSIPNYDIPCEVCGNAPTVDVKSLEGHLIMRPNLCGPCFFGTADAIDPENW